MSVLFGLVGEELQCSILWKMPTFREKTKGNEFALNQMTKDLYSAATHNKGTLNSAGFEGRYWVVNVMYRLWAWFSSVVLQEAGRVEYCGLCPDS